jgi:hypothetical protein
VPPAQNEQISHLMLNGGPPAEETTANLNPSAIPHESSLPVNGVESLPHHLLRISPEPHGQITQSQQNDGPVLRIALTEPQSPFNLISYPVARVILVEGRKKGRE